MQSAPPPLPAGSYPRLPPPLPPRKHVTPILVVVSVALLVIGLAIAGIFLYLLLPFESPPVGTVPSVTLGPVGLLGGNATFNVSYVTATAPIGFFRVNLQVDTATGTNQPLELDQRFASVLVSSQRYRVYFNNTGSNLTLGDGDRFTITGNGTPLLAGASFTFYLLWIIGGRLVGSTNWTTPKPLVRLNSVDFSLGNATIPVAGASQAVSPSNYKLNLQVGSNTGTAVAMPTTGGLFATMVINSVTYRIYWTDIGGEKTVNSGDNFRITGNNAALTPAGTPFVFYLLWSDGSLIRSASWSTP